MMQDFPLGCELDDTCGGNRIVLVQELLARCRQRCSVGIHKRDAFFDQCVEEVSDELRPGDGPELAAETRNDQ